MKYTILPALILCIICQYPLHSAYSGLDSSKRGWNQTFRYEVSGEVQVKPDKALFPVILETQANDFPGSLERAQKLFHRFVQEAQELQGARVSLLLANFDKTQKYGREYGSSSITFSFLGSDKKSAKARTHLQFFLCIDFSAEDDFWVRATLLSEALEFVTQRQEQFKKDDDVNVDYGEMLLNIENPEQYRKQIITAIYAKAKTVADAIAEQEQVTPFIREITFSQHIKQDIVNIYKAALSLDANIVFGFE